jgi:hypothetical protein
MLQVDLLIGLHLLQGRVGDLTDRNTRRNSEPRSPTEKPAVTTISPVDLPG